MDEYSCPNCGSSDTYGNGDNTNVCNDCGGEFHDSQFGAFKCKKCGDSTDLLSYFNNNDLCGQCIKKNHKAITKV